VDELLTRLETAADGLEDFTAQIVLEKYDALLDETERRYGKLVLEAIDSPSSAEGSPSVGRDRRFAFLFDRFIDGSGIEDASRDHWIFAGGWLAEVNHKRKTFTKRQIVEPGKRFDPLKLGEGPFPLPLGQPKQEVLSRFEVSMAGDPTLPLFKGLQQVDGLRLVPKPGTPMAKETEQVEVWYDRATLLPRGLTLRQRTGDRTAVLLLKPTRNAGLNAEERELLTMPVLDPAEWAIEIRRWSDGAAATAGEPTAPVAQPDPAPRPKPAEPTTPAS
jgi:hypothetical protein